MVKVYPKGGGRPRPTFLDEANAVRSAIPNVMESASSLGLCDSCGDALWSYWHGGAIYTLADGKEANKDGTTSRRHTFAKWQEGKWRVLASLRTGARELLGFVPCDGDRFIVISDETDLFDNKRQDRSPFCRVSLQEGREEMKLDFSIDHGQEGLRKYMVTPDCFKLAWYSKVVMTDNHATLVNRDTGMYWVFSMETATLVKAGSIFKGVTPEMVVSGGFDRAVLCVNPEKTGTVLVSAQDEALFLAEKEDVQSEAKALFAMYPDGRRDEEILTHIERRMEEIRGRSSKIVWYRIFPDTGSVERLKEPPEGGASFREGWKNDVWRPLSDGSVKMGWDPDYLDGLRGQVFTGVGDAKEEVGTGGQASPEEEPPSGGQD
jgi:hypothetical protein